MSQAEFGRLVGVGQSMVQQWVSRKRPISIVKVLDIEKVFGIDANLLNQEISIIENRLLDRRTNKMRILINLNTDSGRTSTPKT